MIGKCAQTEIEVEQLRAILQVHTSASTSAQRQTPKVVDITGLFGAEMSFIYVKSAGIKK